MQKLQRDLGLDEKRNGDFTKHGLGQVFIYF